MSGRLRLPKIQRAKTPEPHDGSPKPPPAGADLPACRWRLSFAMPIHNPGDKTEECLQETERRVRRLNRLWLLILLSVGLLWGIVLLIQQRQRLSPGAGRRSPGRREARSPAV